MSSWYQSAGIDSGVAGVEGWTRYVSRYAWAGDVVRVRYQFFLMLRDVTIMKLRM
jgi:hypothetical protein